ncbi:MAG: helix-turn-helix domain-containing protein [Alphaproteobacteria bacterium]|nr:helix-turn-helix domain-containing protein [Alphaproteobacteria bacterium]
MKEQIKEAKIIGKNISRLRKEQKLTQEDLCGLADLDRSNLSGIENGIVDFRITTLVRIAQALEVELGALVKA